jgi:hypothetical protein
MNGCVFITSTSGIISGSLACSERKPNNPAAAGLAFRIFFD